MPDSSTAATWFRQQRVDQAKAPERVRAHLDEARRLATGMDENDSDLRALAFVVCHCTEALCTALDDRT